MHFAAGEGRLSHLEQWFNLLRPCFSSISYQRHLQELCRGYVASCNLNQLQKVGRKILSQEIYHKYLPSVLLKTQEIRVNKQIHIMILNLHYAVTVYVIIINYTNSNNINDNRIILVMILQMTLSLMSQLPCKQLTLVFISINYEDDNLIAVVIMITVVKLMLLTLK